MRHRIIENDALHLGNTDPVRFDNQDTQDEGFNEKAKEAMMKGVNTFKPLKDIQGCDYQLDLGKKTISFGYEPAYMYEPYFCISIDLNDRTNSYIQRGKSWGGYGSGIAKNTKVYRDYKVNSKFKKFVDMVCDEIFKEAK